MNKLWICAAAIGAALAFSAPAASAKDGFGHGYKPVKMVKTMPMRSNKYGMRRGHARADYVHSLNRSRKY